jgi:hypothetical protein
MAKGGRKRRVSDEEILDVFRNTTKPELTANDVAEELPIKRRAVLNRLGDLEEEGELGKRTVGGTSVIWWLPEVRIAIERLRERGELLDRAEDSPPQTPDSHAEERAAEPPTEPETGEGEILDGVDFPAGRDREECVEAVLAARDYLRENGKASMREFVREVMPDHPLGYDVPQLEAGERYRGAWWRRIIKPGLSALPDVKSPAPGQSEWRYVAD